jgi:hypothetical protein
LKNVLLYYHPSGKISQEADRFLRINILNSLRWGWPKQDIWVFSNVKWQESGVKSQEIPNFSFYPVPGGSFHHIKIWFLSWALEHNLVKDHWWIHDLDLFQVQPLVFPFENSPFLWVSKYSHRKGLVLHLCQMIVNPDLAGGWEGLGKLQPGQNEETFLEYLWKKNRSLLGVLPRHWAMQVFQFQRSLKFLSTLPWNLHFKPRAGGNVKPFQNSVAMYSTLRGCNSKGWKVIDDGLWEILLEQGAVAIL